MNGYLYHNETHVFPSNSTKFTAPLIYEFFQKQLL